MKLDFGDYVVATILLGTLTIFPADQLKSVVGVANAIQAVPEKADKLFHIDLTKGVQVGEKIAGYEVTSGFGPRLHPVTGEVGAFHNGLDLAAPIGTPIYAPFDLHVRDASSDAGGLCVIASSDATPGYEFGFCHLSKAVKLGKVGKGQIFALSGNSGAHTTGPHLHKTLRKKQANGTWETIPPARGIVYAFMAGYAEK